MASKQIENPLTKLRRQQHQTFEDRCQIYLDIGASKTLPEDELTTKQYHELEKELKHVPDAQITELLQFELEQERISLQALETIKRYLKFRYGQQTATDISPSPKLSESILELDSLLQGLAKDAATSRKTILPDVQERQEKQRQQKGISQ